MSTGSGSLDVTNFVIGITGHRDIPRGRHALVESALIRVLGRVRAALPAAELLLLSPLAEGADRILAMAAIRHGTPFEAVLPMPREDYEKDFRTAESLAEFRSLLRQAAAVVELPAAAVREDAYTDVGAHLIDHCHLLIAAWDGEPSTARGGTAHTLAEALSREEPPLLVVVALPARLKGSVPGSLDIAWLSGKAGDVLRAPLDEPGFDAAVHAAAGLCRPGLP